MTGNIDTRAYRQARKTFRAECAQADAPCWLCRMPIEYTVEWPDPESFKLDHLYPRSTRPQYTLDPAGFRASHKRCNGSRGNYMPAVSIGTPAPIWLR